MKVSKNSSNEILKSSKNSGNPKKPEKIESCPIAKASHILGDTWTLLIIYYLLQKEMRFGELQKNIETINSRTLTIRLKLLEKNGFIDRKQYNQIPPKVVYSITPKGQKLQPLLNEITILSKYL